MNLGRTLAGAAIGAAIGLGLHLALGAVAKTEGVWFAVITGALTGLGVRQAHKSLAGQVSYARGAVSAIIALVAIVASLYLVRVVIAKTENKLDLIDRTPIDEPLEAPDGTPAVVEEPAGEGTAAETASEEPAGGPTVGEVPVKPAGRIRATAREDNKLELPDFNVWDFLCIGLGVFLAYQFARGTGLKAPGAPSPEPA